MKQKKERRWHNEKTQSNRHINIGHGLVRIVHGDADSGDNVRHGVFGNCLSSR